jgi:hypothetical protein
MDHAPVTRADGKTAWARNSKRRCGSASVPNVDCLVDRRPMWIYTSERSEDKAARYGNTRVLLRCAASANRTAGRRPFTELSSMCLAGHHQPHLLLHRQAALVGCNTSAEPHPNLPRLALGRGLPPCEWLLCFSTNASRGLLAKKEGPRFIAILGVSADVVVFRDMADQYDIFVLLSWQPSMECWLFQASETCALIHRRNTRLLARPVACSA